MRDSDTNYYLFIALQALETAYSENKDLTVAKHLSQAMEALHRVTHKTGKITRGSHQATYDPHEMDEFNSAV